MAKNVQLITQVGEACGTTTLAMILNAFHVTRTPARKFDQATLDDEIRRMNVFTAPVSVADLARRFKVASVMVNNADFGLLERMVRRGNVAQLIVDAPQMSRGNNPDANMHYVVVDWVWEGPRSEFEANMADARFFTYKPNEVARWARIKDPQGAAYIIRFDHLEQRYWSNIRFKHLKTGFSNFAILYGNTDADLANLGGVYSTFDATAAIVIATNTSELLNAVVHAAKFKPWVLPEVIKQSVDTILGSAAMIVKATGSAINDLSGQAFEKGKELLVSKDSNAVERAGGALIAGVSGALWLASTPVEWLGNGFALVVDFVD